MIVLPLTGEIELSEIQKDNITESIVRYIFAMPVNDRNDIAELIELLQRIQTDAAIDESLVREAWQVPLYTLREYLKCFFSLDLDATLRQPALAFAQAVINARIDFLRKAQSTEMTLACYQHKQKRSEVTQGANPTHIKYTKNLYIPFLQGIFDSYCPEKQMACDVIWNLNHFKRLTRLEEWHHLLLDPNVNVLVRRQQIEIWTIGDGGYFEADNDSYSLAGAIQYSLSFSLKKGKGFPTYSLNGYSTYQEFREFCRRGGWTIDGIRNLAKIALIPCVNSLLENKMITLENIYQWGEEETLRLAKMALTPCVNALLESKMITLKNIAGWGEEEALQMVDAVAQPRVQEFFAKTALEASAFMNHHVLQHCVMLFFKFEDLIVEILGIPNLPRARGCLLDALSESEESFNEWIECIKKNIIFFRVGRFDSSSGCLDIPHPGYVLRQIYANQSVIADIQDASVVVQDFLSEEKIYFEWSGDSRWSSPERTAADRQTYLAALEHTEIREAITYANKRCENNLSRCDIDEFILENKARYLVIALHDPVIKAALMDDTLTKGFYKEREKTDKRSVNICKLIYMGRLMAQTELLPLFSFGYLQSIEFLDSWIGDPYSTLDIQDLVILSQERLLFALRERVSDPTLKAFGNIGQPDGVSDLQAALSPLFNDKDFREPVTIVFSKVLKILERKQTSSATSTFFRDTRTTDLYTEEYKKFLDYSIHSKLNTFHKVGLYFLQQGNEELAYANFTCAHDGEADYLDALIQAANIAYARQHYDEAVSFFTQAERVSKEKRPGDLQDIRFLLTASKAARDGKDFTLHDASRIQSDDPLPDTQEKLLTFR